MHHRFDSRRRPIAVLILLCLYASGPMPSSCDAQEATESSESKIRIATYNVSLYGSAKGDVAKRLRDQEDEQARKIATVVQLIRPDILLVNELDHDMVGRSARLLAENYFAVDQEGTTGIKYPYIYAPPSNTGQRSGLDLDGDRRTGGPADAWGYGAYAGQYAMAIFSRFPFDRAGIRTFQEFRWKQLPGALRPVDPASGRYFYDDATWNLIRLSSKNHIDVPFQIHGLTLHVLASHPTPPVFDGDEDRNGRRNHDEIRFWSDYLSDPDSEYLVDDLERVGGLALNERFVIVGDLNADPERGESVRNAIRDLIAHSRVQDPRPTRHGTDDEREVDIDTEPSHESTATADFGRNGQLRVDYVLPSAQLTVTGSGVFWPDDDDRNHSAIAASDHRLVWVDVEAR